MVSVDRSRRVALGQVGVTAGRRYAVRVRVWRGRLASVWSRGVVVAVTAPTVPPLPDVQATVTPAGTPDPDPPDPLSLLPPPIRLPAALAPSVDMARLTWGDAVTLDTAGRPCLPSVCAVDGTRAVVAWVRYWTRVQLRSGCACVGRVDGRHRGHWVQQLRHWWIQEHRAGTAGHWVGVWWWSGSGISGWCVVVRVWTVSWECGWTMRRSWAAAGLARRRTCIGWTTGCMR